MTPTQTNIKAAFYIPFGYLYCVRLRSTAKLLSWLLLYILPTAFYAAVGYPGTPVSYIIRYTLVLLATFTLYELGYIFNDTLAIQHEEAPSLRLTEKETNYFFSHQWRILVTRVLIASVCLFALSFHTAILPITLSIGAMCILFAIYNRWRNKYNVFLYIWLVFSRYIPFMMLCGHEKIDYLLLFLSYPLLIGIERFSMPAYRWPFLRTLIPDEPSKARFRAAYYVLVLVILLPVFYITQTPFYLLIPIAVLALYRIVRILKKI